MNNVQKSCEIVEELLAIEASEQSKRALTTKQFLALNTILLEMQKIGKYDIPEGIH